MIKKFQNRFADACFGMHDTKMTVVGIIFIVSSATRAMMTMMMLEAMSNKFSCLFFQDSDVTNDEAFLMVAMLVTFPKC
jgi:hypothetical protein